MTPDLTHALAEALGDNVHTWQPLSGGDINDAYRVEFENRECVFVKANAAAPPGMFEAESQGLQWLAQSEAVRVPQVVAIGDRKVPFLALEFIASGQPAPKFDEQLGRQLAALHRCYAKQFGLDHDNFIGTVPQSNTSEQNWDTFYWTRRIEPLVRTATDRSLLPSTMTQRFDKLESRLPRLVGDPEAPARLHGDLWSGNVHIDANGEPVLIDPAAYGGHREMDLAMLRLFGGVRTRVFAAYEEAFPLSPGALDRVPLCQLYPLLVHVLLFGSSYVGAVDRALRRYD